MAEEKIAWVQIILKEAVRAGTWGIVLFVIFSIFLATIKQNVKEAIDFGAKQAVYEAVRYATDPFLIGKGKQLVKEGIEYTLDKAGEKYQDVIVEAIETARIKSGEAPKEKTSEKTPSQ